MKPFSLSQHLVRSAVNVKDWPYNAKGDGFVDDTDAIQRAINDSAGSDETTRRTVHFPAGNYYISAPIVIPNYTHITGDGPAKSRINLQGKPYTSHIFTNANASTWGWLIIENFAFRGGSTALLNQSASQENWILRNVSFEIQSIAAIQTGDWQINQLQNCVFYYCGEGVRTHGFANLNNYIGCEFDGLARQAIRHDSSGEVNNFIGCRFEGGGADASTFELYNSRNTNFYGCYFEATHIRVLNQFSGSATIFDACHFTYPASPTVTNPQYEFNSAIPIQFGTNTWGRKSDGATRMRITGDNGKMLGKNNSLYGPTSRRAQELIGPSHALAAGNNSFDTVRLVAEILDNTLNASLALYGELRVLMMQASTGGFVSNKAVRIPVVAGLVGSGAYGVSFGTITTDFDNTGGAVTIGAVFTAPDRITITVNGVGANIVGGFATWQWRSFGGANPGYYPLAVDFWDAAAVDLTEGEEQ